MGCINIENHIQALRQFRAGIKIVVKWESHLFKIPSINQEKSCQKIDLDLMSV